VISRAFLFAPLALLMLWAGYTALRYGTAVARLTETDVINTYADLYLEEAGAGSAITDCHAVPSPDRDVWLVVRCGGYVYSVNRIGGLVRKSTPQTRAREVPQT
jgi:hypothetical protein